MRHPSVTIILQRAGSLQERSELNAWDFLTDNRAQDIFDALCEKIVAQLTPEERALINGVE